MGETCKPHCRKYCILRDALFQKCDKKLSECDALSKLNPNHHTALRQNQSAGGIDIFLLTGVSVRTKVKWAR